MYKSTAWIIGAAVTLGALIGISSENFGVSFIDWTGLSPELVLIACVAITAACVLGASFARRRREG